MDYPDYKEFSLSILASAVHYLVHAEPEGIQDIGSQLQRGQVFCTGFTRFNDDMGMLKSNEH